MAPTEIPIHVLGMSTPVAARPLELDPRSDLAPAIGTPDVETRAPAPHPLSRRLIERFALIAFGLYHLPLFLNNYPTLGGGGFSEGLAVSWGHVFTPPGVWVARHVFHVTGPMPSAYNGDNGDVGEEFGRLLLAVVIGAVAAIVWTIVDRKRPRSRWVGDGLQLLLRYSIALGLMSYAIAKILPQQFPPLTAFTLEQRVGDLTPMALLWTFMEYSRPYAFFGGLMELAAVLLLCVRRTATLGACICVAVMTNVALMNYAYGVPVKLYATMTLLSAAVLLLYDTPRLMAVFIKNETAPPVHSAPQWQDRIPTPLRWTIKIALVGSVLLSSVAAMRGTLNRPAAPTGLDGLWVVTSFTRDNPAADSTRWSQVIVRGTNVLIRLTPGRFLSCQATPQSTPDAMIASCSGNRHAELRWTRNGSTAQIDGTVDGSHVTAGTRHVSESDYRLMQGKFRWIID
jgi:hypothetical protein